MKNVLSSAGYSVLFAALFSLLALPVLYVLYLFLLLMGIEFPLGYAIVIVAVILFVYQFVTLLKEK